MGSFIEELLGSSTGAQVTQELSSKLGLPKENAQGIVQQVAPMILAGLKKQMETHGGPERVDHILNKYGDDSVLENVPHVIDSKLKEDQADPGLGGLLGDSGFKAADLLSKQFGIDGSTAMKLIPALSPIILGMLTRKKKQENGLSGIASLIDQDGDGSILDDVAGFLMGGSGGAKQMGGNLLGGLMGSIFGRKR